MYTLSITNISRDKHESTKNPWSPSDDVAEERRKLINAAKSPKTKYVQSMQLSDLDYFRDV